MSFFLYELMLLITCICFDCLILGLDHCFVSLHVFASPSAAVAGLWWSLVQIHVSIRRSFLIHNSFEVSVNIFQNYQGKCHISSCKCKLI